MKTKLLNICIMALAAVMFACGEEEPIGVQPMDSVPPSPVENITWDSIPGGIVLRYKLPADEDLLNVKAVYTNEKGQTSESIASIYSDSLAIQGFNMPKVRDITLYAVDRSRNVSEGRTVPNNPINGVPDIYYIGNSLRLVPDFGGVHAFWDNPNRKEISVVILYKDNNGEYVPLNTYYSTAVAGEAVFNGMDTIPIDVAVFAQDRWENRTEMFSYNGVIPIFETQLDKTLYKPNMLDNDGPPYTGGGSWSQLQSIWNGQKGDDSGFSTQGGAGVWPQSITIDLGMIVKLSRIRLYQRMGSYIWSEGNPSTFEVWGMQETPPQNGDWSTWTKMMDCKVVKPSGLPLGQYTAEDEAVAREGEDFYNSPENPRLRYIRIKITRTLAGGDNFQINEMEFFGDPRSE